MSARDDYDDGYGTIQNHAAMCDEIDHLRAARQADQYVSSAVDGLLRETTEHADGMRDLLASIAADHNAAVFLHPTIVSAVDAYDNFIKEC